MDKLYIIKIGGNIIDDENALSAFLKSFSAINDHKILVHGGGKLATQMAEKMQVPQKMIEGRRITDADTLRIITMVYAGLINKRIVAELQSYHCNAIGLTGADGDSILSHKRKHPVIDYGFVGDIDAINGTLLSNLLSLKLVPVFAPLTHDQTGQLLNTNADTIAQELAKSLGDLFDTVLVYSFEKPGVLLDAEDNNSLIPRLTRDQYNQLRTEGKIFAGMIPKLDNAFAALQHGVHRVIIGKADNLQDLLQGKNGTQITND